MEVTIITSCLNRVGSIQHAIDSVLAQDYPNIEYIVVDGAATDGSLDIINRNKEKISKVISEHDNGMYEGLNKGIRLASGDIIGMCHSDDQLFNSHTVSDVVKQMEKTGADILYADGLYLNEKGKPVRKWIGGKCTKFGMKFCWLPLHTTTFIRKRVFETYGLYDERYKVAADTDFLLRLLYDNKLKLTYLNQCVVKMKMGGMSTDFSNRMTVDREDLKILASHGMKPAWFFKTCKMAWKVPQFIRAKYSNTPRLRRVRIIIKEPIRAIAHLV